MCPETNPGDKGMINEIEYESVDNELVRLRRDEGADMTKLCTSLVTDLEDLFSESDFNQPIGNWDVSQVQDMDNMFDGSSFDQPIGDWDVSNVTSMYAMFYDSPFNQSLAEWNVSNVEDMRYMFENSGFNQDISDWCVTGIEVEPENFSVSSPLTVENSLL